MANSQVQYFKACSNTRTVNTRFLKLTEVFQLWNFQHTVVIAYKQLTLNANSDQLLYVLNRNAVIGQSSFALLSGLTGLLRWWGGHTPSGVARIPEKRNMSLRFRSLAVHSYFHFLQPQIFVDSFHPTAYTQLAGLTRISRPVPVRIRGPRPPLRRQCTRLLSLLTGLHSPPLYCLRIKAGHWSMKTG